MLHVNPSFVHRLSVSLLPLWTTPPSLGKDERTYWEFQWLPYKTAGPFRQCPHFSVLAAHQLLAGIHSAGYDPETSKCVWPASQFFFTFTHIISKPLLLWGFQEPTAGCVSSRPSALEFAPSRDTPHSYLIFTRSGRSSTLCSGSAAHSRLRNSWQFFWVERLSLNIRDMKSAYTFGRVTARYNHMASLECP